MTKGFVYLIEETDGATGQLTGYYKIGKTTNLESRIRAFRTASKNGLQYRKTIEVDDYSEAEAAAHNACSQYKMPGENGGKEWFDFRAVDIGRIEALLAIIQSEYPAHTPVQLKLDQMPTHRPSRGSPSFFSFGGFAEYLFALFLLLGLFFAVTRGNNKHEVVIGDTLSRLEREYRLEPGQLKRINPGIDPDRLQPGQKLNIPPTQSSKNATQDKLQGNQYRTNICEGCQVRVFDTPLVGQKEIGRIDNGQLIEAEVDPLTPGWLKTRYGWIHRSQLAR